MARAANQTHRGDKPDVEKRARMKQLIEQGVSIGEIAARLGYANRRSAFVMAHRWGLNTLLPESFVQRAANSNQDYETTVDRVRETMETP